MSRTIRNRKNTGNCWYLKKRWANDEWAQDYIKKAHRDGKMSDGGNASYKWYSDWNRRCKEKQFFDKIKKYDLDNIGYPCEKELKYLAWVIW